MQPEVDVLVSLPDAQREAFKRPLGPISTDIESILAEADGPVITVGDVVSYHAVEAGHQPALSIVDGRTKRSAVDPEIAETLAEERERSLSACNPPGTLTTSLVSGITEGLATDEPVQLVVDGEEDLAALPAVVRAPDGASVLYGQPDAGVVHVRVNEDTRAKAWELLDKLEGDRERFDALLREDL